VVTFADRAHGPQRQAPTEDPILVRADGEAAYPLAVVLDDLRDGVTEVVRGGDLLEATGTQVALYGCLGHPAPTWLHTPVLLGPDGRKLSKSHGSTELRALRSAGWSAGRVWATLLPLLGLRGSDLRPEHFDPERVALGHFTVDGEGTVLGPSTAQKSL
jgi:glutamyl/glutaminyl-tRNA synthetase